MTPDELHRFIIQGENASVEFKEQATEDVLGGLSTDIAALANTQGGIIVFGITDKKDPMGCILKGGERERISHEASNCRPAITTDFDEIAFATRNFLVVKVPRSSIVHSDNRRRFPVPIGNTTDHLDSVGLSVLLRERGQVSHEQAQQVAAQAERERHPIPGDELSLLLRTLKDGRPARLEALRDFWALTGRYVILDREDVASAIEGVLTSGSEEEKESTLDALRAIHQFGTAAEKETLWRWRDILKHIAMSSPRTQTASKAFFILVLLMDEFVIEVLMH